MYTNIWKITMTFAQTRKTKYFFLLYRLLFCLIAFIVLEANSNASIIKKNIKTYKTNIKTYSCKTPKHNHIINAEKDSTKEKPCITKYPYGSVNWHTGEVKASGIACPADKKRPESSELILSKAKANASHHLMTILKRIGFAAIKNNSDDRIFHKDYYPGRIPGKKTSNFVSLRDIILAGIETIAANAKITEQHYASDRSAEVTIETSIFGGFLQLVLPDSIREIPKINYIESNNKNLAADTNEHKEKFTGLIIDARGLKFQPVIYPIIISEQGERIYSSTFISREYAVQRGVCGYACTMTQALHSKRTGKNPIIIKGLRTGGPDNSYIIISSLDAEKIERATEHYSFMKECKVIIVLD